MAAKRHDTNTRAVVILLAMIRSACFEVLNRHIATLEEDIAGQQLRQAVAGGQLA
jgi:hypothetical protein